MKQIKIILAFALFLSLVGCATRNPAEEAVIKRCAAMYGAFNASVRASFSEFGRCQEEGFKELRESRQASILQAKTNSLKKECISMGFKAETPELAQCVLTLRNHDSSTAVNASLVNALAKQQEENQLNAATRNLLELGRPQQISPHQPAPPPPTQSRICNTRWNSVSKMWQTICD